MDWFKWIFDGIGTEILSLILGGILGLGVGYKIGVNKQSLKQKQKAGDNSQQVQIGKNDGKQNL